MLISKAIKLTVLFTLTFFSSSLVIAQEKVTRNLKSGEILLPSGVHLQNVPLIRDSAALKEHYRNLALKQAQERASSILKMRFVILNLDKVQSFKELCDEFIAHRLQPMALKTHKKEILLQFLHKKQVKAECSYAIGSKLILSRDIKGRRIYPSYKWHKIKVPGFGVISVANLGIKREMLSKQSIAEYLIVFNSISDYRDKLVKTAHMIGKRLNELSISQSDNLNNFYFTAQSDNSIGYQLPTTSIAIRPIGRNSRVGITKISLVYGPVYRAELKRKEKLFVYVIRAHSDALDSISTKETKKIQRKQQLKDIAKKTWNTAEEIMEAFGKAEADRLDIKRVFLFLYFKTQDNKILKVKNYYTKEHGSWIPRAGF